MDRDARRITVSLVQDIESIPRLDWMDQTLGCVGLKWLTSKDIRYKVPKHVLIEEVVVVVEW